VATTSLSRPVPCHTDRHTALQVVMGGEETYHSPPLGWPRCFKTAALQEHLKGLGAQRVRLCNKPSEDDRALITGVVIYAGDSRGNAIAVEQKLGWQVQHGFILKEKTKVEKGADAVERYVAQPHWWNEKPGSEKGIWVDFTPRDEERIVLVETMQAPAFGAVACLPTASPTKPPQPAADPDAACAAPAAACVDSATGGPEAHDEQERESRPCSQPGCSQVGKLRCGVCQKVRYCSAECQRKAWPEHKIVCRPIAAMWKKPGSGAFGWDGLHGVHDGR